MGGNLKEIIGGSLYYSGILQFYSKFIRGKSTYVRALVYHQVTNDSWSSKEHFPVPGVISLSKFESQIKYLKEHFEFVSLDQFIDFIEGRNVRANSVLLTFDDGYRNIYEYAFKVLREHNLPAVVFITGDVLQGKSLWCDELLDLVIETEMSSIEIDGRFFDLKIPGERLTLLRHLGSQLQKEKRDIKRERMLKISEKLEKKLKDCNGKYLSKEQILEMQEFGISFGAHTMSHPLLGFVRDQKELEWEIDGSIRAVEEVTGRKCLSFAYPFGDDDSYSDACVRLLKGMGIKLAFTTHRGAIKLDCDPYHLNRFIIQGNSKYFFRVQLSGLLDG
jgi:peptidoglycan/xylan/chitin deacetylase (PgdA/CDA1 family)